MKKILLVSFCAIFLSGCAQKGNKITPNHSDNSISFLNNSDIRINEKVFHRSLGDCNSESNCAKIHIEYPEIISSGEVYDSINVFIKNMMLNISFNEYSYGSLDEIADSLFSNFLTIKEDFPTNQMGWFINTKISITGFNFDILSLKHEESIFTGGANPSYNLLYYNFDATTGLELYLSDIITDDNISKLETEAENIFRKLKGINDKESLEDRGFWFEKNQFSLNDNFAVTDSGIVFFYNLYEIAPRSNGTTEVFIPKNKLIDLTTIYK